MGFAVDICTALFVIKAQKKPITDIRYQMISFRFLGAGIRAALKRYRTSLHFKIFFALQLNCYL
jgi:hypothetical protein